MMSRDAIALLALGFFLLFAILIVVRNKSENGNDDPKEDDVDDSDDEFDIDEFYLDIGGEG